MHRSSLELDRDTMRRYGRLVADIVADHLATLRDQPAINSAELPRSPVLSADAPAHGTAFESLIEALQRDVFPFAAREPHPGFMAYVPSCPTFPAVMGDWLATGYNFYAGVWPVAAGPNQLEVIVLEWFRSWLGMPPRASGLLTSGGSGANLTAMIAARHHATAGDARQIARLTVYASDQAHSSVTRAAWLAGIGRENVRTIATDEHHRLDVGALSEAIARDRANRLVPAMVVGNAGTTNTGAVDPLRQLAVLCHETQVWLHIDAAYGGFAILTTEGRRLLEGIELADSVTLDPHKWLFVPFECGCLLVREPQRLKSAFQILPEYLADVQGEHVPVNFADYGEQLTRYSRALKIWLSVRFHGTDALGAAIERAMMLARRLEQRVADEATLEVMSPARVGIVCFRVRARADAPHDVEALNARVLARLTAAGRYFISSTRLRGVFVLRACVLGFRTDERDVDGLVDAVVRAAEEETSAPA